MSQLYLFNPGYEMEILYGKSHFTPPFTIQKMVADLELLPVWYGGGGSFTLVRNIKSTQFVKSMPKFFQQKLSSPMILNPMMRELFKCKKSGKKPNLPVLNVEVWGLSSRCLEVFQEFKTHGMNINIPEWKDEIGELTKRQTAATCLTRLQERCPITPTIEIPQFYTDIEGIKSYMQTHEAPYVLKTPLSSSGRGLHWIKDNKLATSDETWLSGSFKRQGAVSIEPALNKALDFAAEFYSDGEGNIEYVCLSVFETQANGQFVGCLLGTQESLLQRLNEYISPDDYMFLVEQIRQVLTEVIGNNYKGFLGVDMMIYHTNDGNYAVHPFVELNLRNTMGIVAMQLSMNFIHPESQGLFRINYYVYDAEQQHQRMMAESPLICENNLIRSGYLSLCPVYNDTHYLAFVEVF
ncbi:MAG: hypothetical protein LBD53_10550 [Tannerella sp.]|jgi:hypothetical protein|nr:hypothetical protein [Tannerella sp.]